MSENERTYRCRVYYVGLHPLDSKMRIYTEVWDTFDQLYLDDKIPSDYELAATFEGGTTEVLAELDAFKKEMRKYSPCLFGDFNSGGCA